MTKELELLLKDLCARLPYGVKLKFNYIITSPAILKGINKDFIDCDIAACELEDVKPYLFPLSSMTEEQKTYISNRWGINENFDFEINPDWGEHFVTLCDAIEFIDWLNENHFDYRNLIDKNLAIDCTNLNIYRYEKPNLQHTDMHNNGTV